MTTISVESLPLNEMQKSIVRGIVKPNGEFRASKPQTPKMVPFPPTVDRPYGTYDYATEVDAEKGVSAYVWRMVAFQISENPTHHCMPVMAFCYLPYKWQGLDRKQIENWADEIIKAVVDSIPPQQWYGVARWNRVLYG